MEDIHHIKTFELSGSWESLKKSWEMLLLRSKSMDAVRKGFLRRYLFIEFGKELNINETKGVKCVRVYYNEKDEVLSITAYDKSGYIDYELNLEYSRNEEKSPDRKENNSSVEEEPDEKVYTHVFQEDLFDARGAIARTSSGAPEVVVHDNRYTLHFKNIPACRYDIYMKDPFWVYHTITGMEGRFYELGYKLTEVTHKHVDGIIARSRYMYYDRKGVFLKRVSMCGTPWGGAVVCDEEIWDYNFRDNTATMKEISARQDAIRYLYKYKMDEQGKLRERKEYMYSRKERSSDSADQSTDKLVHSRTLRYAYGKNGKLCEVKTVLCYPITKFERIVYEYDARGRLITQRDYNDKDELVGDETYRYISDTRVEYICHVYMHSNKEQSRSKKQT